LKCTGSLSRRSNLVGDSVTIGVRSTLHNQNILIRGGRVVVWLLFKPFGLKLESVDKDGCVFMNM
jgi:hypothetical protein